MSRFAFVSCHRGIGRRATWGGSEDNWIKTAIRLAERGHQVEAWMEFPDQDHPFLRDLDAAGVKRHHLSDLSLPFADKVRNRFRKRGRKIDPRDRERDLLPAFKPDMVLLSWAMHLDGLDWAQYCIKHHLPYIIMPMLGSDLYWPQDSYVPELRAGYLKARSVFFVSRGNLELTEDQIGEAIPHGQVVRNTFKVDYNHICPWPEAGGEEAFSMACVARLDAANKGQDILLKVLAQEKWRARPLSIHFYGTGHNEQGLKDIAKRYNVTNVHFHGHVLDIGEIWGKHQAFILPSRVEGLPLALVEAMLSGRMCVVSPIPGNVELMVDEETGFIARSVDLGGIDDALERAWARRAEWKDLGLAAARHVRKLVPPDPVAVLADEMERLVTQS